MRYRTHVTQALLALIRDADSETALRAAPLVELGLNHEQQHQELLLTDILHALSRNPLLPAYDSGFVAAAAIEGEAAAPSAWLCHPGGMVETGHAGAGFAFDNETPRHPALLAPFDIATRLVTCGDYLRFIEDGGYRRSEFWLSDGWAAVQAQGWQAPPYWLAPEDVRAPSRHWQCFGLNGVQALDPHAPAMQLSFFEAAAYAQWAGARLPTEFEWEATQGLAGMRQVTGQAWQWTRSSYDPYPGFRPWSGAIAEYNGKFMVGQLVLRGGSLATPAGHTRPTYRNFFPPAARWQFSGVRLARDAKS
jgi:ergothioneine biosynthesis protein EgtB